jgi:hypothetical protein
VRRQVALQFGPDRLHEEQHRVDVGRMREVAQEHDVRTAAKPGVSRYTSAIQGSTTMLSSGEAAMLDHVLLDLRCGRTRRPRAGTSRVSFLRVDLDRNSACCRWRFPRHAFRAGNASRRWRTARACRAPSACSSCIEPDAPRCSGRAARSRRQLSRSSTSPMSFGVRLVVAAHAPRCNAAVYFFDQYGECRGKKLSPNPASR